eukprot:scaffold731_cov261-Pinguiococcus_pyrenoidosus.AAC.57
MLRSFCCVLTLGFSASADSRSHCRARQRAVKCRCGAKLRGPDGVQGLGGGAAGHPGARREDPRYPRQGRAERVDGPGDLQGHPTAGPREAPPTNDDHCPEAPAHAGHCGRSAAAEDGRKILQGSRQSPRSGPAAAASL